MQTHVQPPTNDEDVWLFPRKNQQEIPGYPDISSLNEENTKNNCFFHICELLELSATSFMSNADVTGLLWRTVFLGSQQSCSGPPPPDVFLGSSSSCIRLCCLFSALFLSSYNIKYSFFLQLFLFIYMESTEKCGKFLDLVSNVAKKIQTQKTNL